MYLAHQNDLSTIYCGDCLEVLKMLPDESIQCCVTSPPYWGLRDYGMEGQFGLEATPEEFVSKIVTIFREVKRVMKSDGTLWLNIGDSYAATSSGAGGMGKQWSNKGTVQMRGITKAIPDGVKRKDLVGIPWMVAFALRADGWYLRSDIIWAKPNPMPESVMDRPTKSHEYIFLMTKNESYFYDHEAIKEPCETPMDSKAKCAFGATDGKCNTMEYNHTNETGKRWTKTETRNKRSVWEVVLSPYADAHFATYPPDLIKPCILAGTKPGDVVLDPFGGSGTTGKVAIELGRKSLLIELNPKYINLIKQRTNITPGLNL